MGKKNTRQGTKDKSRISSARKVQRTKRRRRAIELKGLEWTYEEIARELKVAKTTAYRYVMEALALEDEETLETAKEWRAFQRHTVRRMTKALLPYALGLDPKTNQPNEDRKPCVKSQHQIIENMRHLSYLDGLNRQFDPDEGIGVVANLFAEAARLAERRDAEEAEAGK